jgi:23S rRNA (uracil1939-C5)-methyltransferase
VGRRRKVKIKEYGLKIIDYSDECRGVAKLDDKTIFVRGALIGEEVKARRYKNNASFEEADTLEVLTKNPDRIDAKCEFFHSCGGCSLQYLSSENQIKLKLDLVKNMFVRGGVEVENWIKPLTSDVWGYRRKARLGVRFVTKKDKAIVGFRERSSNFLTDMDSCEVLHPSIGKNLHRLAECVEKLSIKYKVAQFEVAISESDTVLILRNLEELTTDDKVILRNYADELGIKWQLQSGGVHSIENLSESQSDAPNLTYSHPDHNIVMNFLSNDFTQVNFELNKKMVNLALEFLELNPDDEVLDLFCGLGNFTLPIAKYCKSVVGVEGDLGLVERAKQNAQTNQINNAEFFKADLFEENSGASWARKKYNKALIDPSRSGAAEVIKMLPKFGVEKLVYVSCNPATLVRDSVILKELGYKIKKATVMDMFSQTSHVESIAYFEK